MKLAKDSLAEYIRSNDPVTIDSLKKANFVTDDEINALKERYKHYNDVTKINEKVLEKLKDKPCASYIKKLKADIVNKTLDVDLKPFNVGITYNKLITDYN